MWVIDYHTVCNCGFLGYIRFESEIDDMYQLECPNCDNTFDISHLEPPPLEERDEVGIHEDMRVWSKPIVLANRKHKEKLRQLRIERFKYKARIGRFERYMKRKTTETGG